MKKIGLITVITFVLVSCEKKVCVSCQEYNTVENKRVGEVYKGCGHDETEAMIEVYKFDDSDTNTMYLCTDPQ